MTHPTVLSLGAVPDLSLLLAIGVPVTALALALTAWTIRYRGARPQKRLGSPAVKVAALAALGCTAYSADTSWRFAADYLDMAGTAERVGMFAAAELALFATALMARQNLATQGAPGLPGTLVWVITGVQVIPAYAESGPVGGTVRAFVGPVMAAMLWHLAMGIELRVRTPGAASHGLLAVLGREAHERLLSRLGIAARDRDAAQITRDRATARAVALAARLAERTPKQQQNRRGRRLTRRLSKAIGRASVGTDPAQRAELLNQLAARRHALALATVPLPSPWSPHHDNTTTVTVPAPTAWSTPVPVDGPRTASDPAEDRGPYMERGPAPATGDRGAGTELGTGDRDAGTGALEPESQMDRVSRVGTDLTATKAPAQGPEPRRGPSNTESGTDTTGDRGPSTPDTGTDTTGDRKHKVTLKRKPTTEVKSRADKRSRSRSPQTQRPPLEPEQSVEHLVEQVRPHVPALLERDGNEAVTRVQLREIIRREGLKGGRNDRLGLALQQLRSEDTTTKTRSSTR
ncbi:hypothetical protein [Streptomyces hirsutus]|uniref:hypothetical protein n=1 Tax=Streptomyces hirsutus TaxID=35620 RepID=UPI0006E288D6|nr:hypothetical protein [Streptomyces hirsutus]